MKQTFIIRNNQRHLLLFFAGWGMDETPFLSIHPAECDWMICYDYRSLEFDTTLIQAYPSLPVSQSTAINGTLYPIHETEGITPSVFEGTLQGLNEQTLLKFQRRMCGSAADYKAFQTMAPKRPVEELKEELAAIRQQYLSSLPSEFVWQTAIIGDNDRIFLPDHQEQAWSNKADSLLHVEAAHYQQELFNKVIMNIK